MQYPSIRSPSSAVPQDPKSVTSDSSATLTEASPASTQTGTYCGLFAHGRWLEKNAERGIDACADAAKAGLYQRVSAGIGA